MKKGLSILKAHSIHYMNERHTITINRDAYLKLKSKGNFGESFSDLVIRLVSETVNKESDAVD